MVFSVLHFEMRFGEATLYRVAAQLILLLAAGVFALASEMGSGRAESAPAAPGVTVIAVVGDSLAAQNEWRVGCIVDNQDLDIGEGLRARRRNRLQRRVRAIESGNHDRDEGAAHACDVPVSQTGAIAPDRSFRRTQARAADPHGVRSRRIVIESIKMRDRD